MASSRDLGIAMQRHPVKTKYGERSSYIEKDNRRETRYEGSDWDSRKYPTQNLHGWYK